MALTQESLAARNAKIAAGGKATRERREKLQAVTYSLKIGRLTKDQEEALTRLFLEAKWYVNQAIAQGDYTVMKRKVTIVSVKTPKGFEDRELKYLGSQVQQGLLQRLTWNERARRESRKNGRKVGRAKYQREVKSIPLKQQGITYSLNDTHTRVRLQNIPGWLPLRGGKQLISLLELANATLVRKPSGLYLLVTGYREPEKLTPTKPPEALDFGVKTHLTYASGREVHVLVKESDRLKRLQRKLERQTKGSNNYHKTCVLLRREYERMGNKKNELANQLVHELKAHSLVVFQDESLGAWKVRYGRQVHHSILGRVKVRLRRLPQGVELERWVATTQTCRKCRLKTKHELGERVFCCSHCGHSEPRDVHSARGMLVFAQEMLPQELGVAPVEAEISRRSTSASLHKPAKQEAVGIQGSRRKRRDLQSRP